MAPAVTLPTASTRAMIMCIMQYGTKVSSSLTTMRHFTLAAWTSNPLGTVMELIQTNVAVVHWHEISRELFAQVGIDHPKNRRSIRHVS